MDLSGIAALCALAGIPATLIVARWQKRIALEQAEANHRTALAQAEAAHRTAMEVAEATHRNALAMAEVEYRNALGLESHRNEIERQKEWRAAQERVFGAVQSVLNRLRVAWADESHQGWMQARSAMDELHDLRRTLSLMSPEAADVLDAIYFCCRRITSFIRARDQTAQSRLDYWLEHVRPLRDELDAVIGRELGSAR
jgi:hypothetical protein